MKANIPFKDGYLQIKQEYHSLPHNVKMWFRDFFWEAKKDAILEKVRSNPESNMHLEIEQVLEQQGIKINVKLKKGR